jgi:hypothetical protein
VGVDHVVHDEPPHGDDDDNDPVRMNAMTPSLLSIRSEGSILSVGSRGSVLSIGSVGSVLSWRSRRSVLGG